jgi:transposase
MLRQARQKLSSFLLRHGHHYNRPAWTLIMLGDGWPG